MKVIEVSFFPSEVVEARGNVFWSTSEEKLFFILFYLKTYPTFDVLGILFEMDRTTACKQSHLLMDVLKDALSMLDVLLSSTKGILKRRGNYVIADGTERPIRKPKNKDNQKEFYSAKKKRHTHKNLILTNKQKAILFLSETISGKPHDITITRPKRITRQESTQRILAYSR